MGLRDRISRLRFPRRPRLQYGLRSLLLAMLIVCLLLGWYVERVRRQREAVAALTEAKAEIDYYDSSNPAPTASINDVETPITVSERIERLMPERLSSALGTDFFRPVDAVALLNSGVNARSALMHLRGLPQLRFLHLSNAHVLDEDLSAIGSLAELKSLELWDALVTDAGMSHLATLENLQYLRIYGGTAHDLPRQERGSYVDYGYRRFRQVEPSISDAGLAHLAKARQLKELELHGHQMRGDGLVHLAAMSDLTTLHLGLTNVRDAGLVHLAGLRQLENLNLEGTPITGAGLSALADLPHLETLNLCQTLVTDDGLTALPSFPALKFLFLSGTAVTDEGLHVLSTITSLKQVSVNHTNATTEGAGWLRRRMPHVSVAFDEQGNVAFTRARLLMRAGLWEEALRTWNQLDASYLQDPEGLCRLGRCHAELGHWEEAENCCCQALDKLEEPAFVAAGYAWIEMLDCPPLFEHLRRVRPHDPDGWIASARLAVIEGRWPAAAADYVRAARCPHWHGMGLPNPNFEYEYALSRLVVGDVAEGRRIAADMIEATQTVRGNLLALIWAGKERAWLYAPQGAFPASQIAAWSQGPTATSASWAFPLLHYRAGRFNSVLEEQRDRDSFRNDDDGRLRFYFTKAMAHQRLGQGAAAREWFMRAAQWLDRHQRISRLTGDYSRAESFLEAEVLRREAERLIYE